MESEVSTNQWGGERHNDCRVSPQFSQQFLSLSRKKGKNEGTRMTESRSKKKQGTRPARSSEENTL